MDIKQVEENVRKLNEEIKPLLKKYHLVMGAVIDFPLYKKLPLEVQLALEVLKKHEVQYKVAFQEEKHDSN